MSKGKDKQAAPGPAAAGPAPAAAAETPAAPATDALARLQDQYLRLQADYDNFRKRTLRDKETVYEQAHQALMLELLPVLDHLHLAQAAAASRQTDPAFCEGLALIRTQLMDVLAKFGLQPIAALGQPFDPEAGEAIRTVPSADVPEGAVLEQVRAGYRLHRRLLRPAQVIVSSGPPPAAPAADAAAPEPPSDPHAAPGRKGQGRGHTA